MPEVLPKLTFAFERAVLTQTFADDKILGLLLEIPRSSDMVDVVNLRRYSCHTEGCDRQAYYNYPGPNRTASKAKYCSTHKLPDMRNVRHRLCQAEGCGTTPTYSFPGDRPRCARRSSAFDVNTDAMEPGTCLYCSQSIHHQALDGLMFC